MTHLDEDRVVLELACQTEDRTDREQRVLLNVAWRLDKQANKLTVDNGKWVSRGFGRRAVRSEPLWDLVGLVRSTRVLVDGQRDVDLPAGVREREARSRVEWERVAAGGCP